MTLFRRVNINNIANNATMPPKTTPTIKTEVYLQTANDWEKWFTRLKELSQRKKERYEAYENQHATWVEGDQ